MEKARLKYRSNILNKHLMVISLLFCGNVFASGPYVEYGVQRLEFDQISTSAQGVTIGYAWREDKNLYLELDMMNSSDDLTYFDLSGAYNFKLIDGENLDLLFNVGVGVSYIDYEQFQNTNTLLSFPVGFTGSYSISEQWNAELSAGYRYHIDLTSPTECNDGTESDSVGSGTCSYHGGIKRYQDQIGDGGGINASLGFRYTY